MTEELTEEEKRIAEARARIEELVSAGGEDSADVPRLMDLMRAYQVVGDAESRMRIMRRLNDIPSAADLRTMAEAVVLAVKAAEEDGPVDSFHLRAVLSVCYNSQKSIERELVGLHRARLIQSMETRL